MSTTLHEGETFSVTRFYGGTERGACLQIGTATGFVQLTMADAARLAAVLREATEGVTAPKTARADAVVIEVTRLGLAGHISNIGVTSEACAAIRAVANGVLGTETGWSSKRPDADGQWLWREGGKDRAVVLTLCGYGQEVDEATEADPAGSPQFYWMRTCTDQRSMPGLWKRIDGSTNVVEKGPSQ